MAFPHPTIDVPGRWPNVYGELAHLQFHDELSTELLRLLDDDPNGTPGHVCATTWILSPDGTSTVLVRHKTLGWSTPGEGARWWPVGELPDGPSDMASCLEVMRRLLAGS
ncbi:MAG: hypothetical protein EBS22_09770, partial [Acidimicrobiia bacterium]|nr:hypothetical protein [Acidimicrobiia bacterium]